MIALPMTTNGNCTHIVPLDGVSYNIRYRWDTRISRMYLDILDVNNSPILMGLKILTNVNLNDPYREPNVPKGLLILLKQESASEDYTFETLTQTNDYALFYFSENEITIRT